MQHDMHDETPAIAREPMPAIAKDAHRIRRFAILGGYAIALVIAGFAGYALRGPADNAPLSVGRSKPTEAPGDSLNPVTTDLPTSHDMPEYVPPATHEHPVDDEEVILNVTWRRPYALRGEATLDVRREFGESSGVDPSAWPTPTFSLVGEIPGSLIGETPASPHKEIIVATIPCEGMCSVSPYYFMREFTGKTYLLAKYSDTEIGTLAGDFTVLTNAIIPDLEFPEKLRGPNDVALHFAYWSRSPFSIHGKHFIFRDEQAGDVFTDDIEKDGNAPLNGFYLPAPDGTYATYAIGIPFMPAGERITDVTWDEGGRNTYDYASSRSGGCGATNITEVIDVTPEDVIRIGRASNGNVVYGFRDSEHRIPKEAYESYFPGYDEAAKRLADKLSYSDFLEQKPFFIWFDPFGRAIKFQRSSFVPLAECGKPVIYLYPEETMDVLVHVAPKGGMTVSEPPHGDGWKVTATPESAITNHADGKTYPYLFWEGRGGLYERPTAGKVVARTEVQSYLTTTLAAYGLNSKEVGDFMEYWLPKMQAKPYYFVTFLTTRAMDELAPLTVTPTPDRVFRILMDYEPLDAPKTVPALPAPRPFVRDGFTVVEWGGVLGRE